MSLRFELNDTEMQALGPGYWKDELSGRLAAAIAVFLNGDDLTDVEVSYLRAYIRQWIFAPIWDRNPHADAKDEAELEGLRDAVDSLTNRVEIERWLHRALASGIDPL